jgi:hypothetical protein
MLVFVSLITHEIQFPQHARVFPCLQHHCLPARTRTRTGAVLELCLGILAIKATRGRNLCVVCV